MKQTKFDSNGIFASTPELSAIALQVLEQEKRERELRPVSYTHLTLPTKRIV